MAVNGKDENKRVNPMLRFIASVWAIKWKLRAILMIRQLIGDSVHSFGSLAVRMILPFNTFRSFTTKRKTNSLRMALRNCSTVLWFVH